MNLKSKIDKLVELALHPSTPHEEARTSAMAALRAMRNHGGEIVLSVASVAQVQVCYVKLKSGDWGIRSDKSLKSQQVVVVTKRNGETTNEKVDQFLGKERGFFMYSIQRADHVLMSVANSARRCTQCAEFIEKGSIIFENASTGRCLCVYCANG